MRLYGSTNVALPRDQTRDQNWKFELGRCFAENATVYPTWCVHTPFNSVIVSCSRFGEDAPKMFVHEVLGPAPLANQVERFSSTLSQCMVQENASRPLVALEDAVDEQRSVIADIARLGLPHDVASQRREALMRAQSSRLANPNAKAVLKRFSDDKEASRHNSPHLTCTDECCS